MSTHGVDGAGKAMRERWGNGGDTWQQGGEARDGERRTMIGMEREHQQHQQRLDSEKQMGLVQGETGKSHAGRWAIAKGETKQCMRAPFQRPREAKE